MRVPALQTPPKFHEKTPRERKIRARTGAEEGKKARSLGRSGRGRSGGGACQLEYDVRAATQQLQVSSSLPLEGKRDETGTSTSQEKDVNSS